MTKLTTVASLSFRKIWHIDLEGDQSLRLFWLFVSLDFLLALSLYYVSETTSVRNEHKKDSERADSRNWPILPVMVDDQQDQTQQGIQYPDLTRVMHLLLAVTPMRQMAADMKLRIWQRMLTMEWGHRNSRSENLFSGLTTIEMLDK